MASLKWIREYNSLFKRINQSGPAYFTGGRFLDIIREFDPDFPDYTQYINHRRSEGKSTSRKDYFYDIFTSFDDDSRDKIIRRIQEEVDNSSVEDSPDIESDIFGFIPNEEPLQKSTSANQVENSQTENNPVVFISYSWDDDEHIEWVRNLAGRLIANGINVLLDQYDLGPGKNMVHFMEQSIRSANKVVIVFTPNYKLKADHRAGGVGYEYSILNAELYRNIAKNEKYIPVLKSGDFLSSIPDFMQQFIAVDMRDPLQLESSTRDIVFAIYGQPQHQRPQLGKRPDFN